MRTLNVVINDHAVATLRDDAGVWSLEYTPEWIANNAGYDLSPALTRATGTTVDGSSQRPVQWFFDALVPGVENAARNLLEQQAHLFNAGEGRLIRRIVHGVIRDMTEKLRR